MFSIYVDDYLVGFEEKKENARKLCEYNNMVEKEYCSGRYWYYTISHDIDEALEMIKDYKKISKKNAFYELECLKSYVEIYFGAEILGGAKSLTKNNVAEIKKLYSKK